MNQIIRQSIIDNVRAFTDKLSDDEVRTLIDYFCYEVNMSDRKDPGELETRFIDEFFGAIDWAKHLQDVDSTKFFLLAPISLRNNLEFIQKILFSDAYFRFSMLLAKQPEPKTITITKTRDLFTPTEKKTLREVLGEHQSMLEYQLEDEDQLHRYDDTGDLVSTKKKHLKFIEKILAKIL